MSGASALDQWLLRRGQVSAAALADALVARRASARPMGSEVFARGVANAVAVYDTPWLRRCIATLAVIPGGAMPEPAAPAHARRDAFASDAAAPVAAMQLEQPPPALDITDADIARGYIDVPDASRFTVATTSRVGYVVDLVPRTPIFTAVSVRSATASAELGPEGGTLVACDVPEDDRPAVLSYRFTLKRDLAPGRYPFPLHLIVRPL